MKDAQIIAATPERDGKFTNVSSPPRKNYMLAVLAAVLASNAVDRLALGLVLQDVKVELHLSDMQLGFLTGIAFALFYSFMGIPIARWADRGNRVTIVTMTTALWSLGVALCGFAGNFLQLMLIRVGVSVGEAGCTPTAHSLIADYFNRTERPRAVAAYMIGGALSFVIGYFVAGWLNELYGWRATFQFLGVPGLLLAALAWFTLAEPRVSNAAHRIEKHEHPSLKQVCVTLWNNRTFRHLLLCFSVMSFFSYGTTQWQPAYFIRSFGLKTGELGTWFAMVYGLGGLLGIFLGGELTVRCAARNERLQLQSMAVLYCTLALVKSLIYLSPNYHAALGFIALGTAVSALVNAPLFASIQTLVPERMRAMAIAIIYLFANLVGMGLGPLVAGALSDAFRPLFGQDSLRYALLAVCPVSLWGAWHAWRASKTVASDLEKVQA